MLSALKAAGTAKPHKVGSTSGSELDNHKVKLSDNSDATAKPRRQQQTKEKFVIVGGEQRQQPSSSPSTPSSSFATVLSSATGAAVGNPPLQLLSSSSSSSSPSSSAMPELADRLKDIPGAGPLSKQPSGGGAGVSNEDDVDLLSADPSPSRPPHQPSISSSTTATAADSRTVANMRRSSLHIFGGDFGTRSLDPAPSFELFGAPDMPKLPTPSSTLPGPASSSSNASSANSNRLSLSAAPSFEKEVGSGRRMSRTPGMDILRSSNVDIARPAATTTHSSNNSESGSSPASTSMAALISSSTSNKAKIESRLLRLEVEASLHKTLEMEYMITLKELQSYEAQAQACEVETARALAAVEETEALLRERRCILESSLQERGEACSVMKYLSSRVGSLNSRVLEGKSRIAGLVSDLKGDSADKISVVDGSLFVHAVAALASPQEVEADYFTRLPTHRNAFALATTPPGQSYLSTRRHSSPGMAAKLAGTLASSSTGEKSGLSSALTETVEEGMDEELIMHDEVTATPSNVIAASSNEEISTPEGSENAGGAVSSSTDAATIRARVEDHDRVADEVSGQYRLDDGSVDGGSQESLQKYLRRSSMALSVTSDNALDQSLQDLALGSSSRFGHRYSQPTLIVPPHFASAVAGQTQGKGLGGLSIDTAGVSGVAPPNILSAPPVPYQQYSSTLASHLSPPITPSEVYLSNSNNNSNNNSGVVTNASTTHPSGSSSPSSSVAPACINYQRGLCALTQRECRSQHVCVRCGGPHPVILCKKDRNVCVKWNMEECSSGCHREHRCLRCAAREHTLRTCPIRPLGGAEFCFAWNSAGTCRIVDCRRLHECIRCGASHPSIICPENLDNYLTEYIKKRKLEGFRDEELLRLEMQLAHALPTTTTPSTSASIAAAVAAGAGGIYTPPNAIFSPVLSNAGLVGGRGDGSDGGGMLSPASMPHPSLMNVAGMGGGTHHPMHLAAAASAAAAIRAVTNERSQYSSAQLGGGYEGRRGGLSSMSNEDVLAGVTMSFSPSNSGIGGMVGYPGNYYLQQHQQQQQQFQLHSLHQGLQRSMLLTDAEKKLVCRDFNNFKCEVEDGRCRFRHVCLRCGSHEHRERNCSLFDIGY